MLSPAQSTSTSSTALLSLSLSTRHCIHTAHSTLYHKHLHTAFAQHSHRPHTRACAPSHFCTLTNPKRTLQPPHTPPACVTACTYNTTHLYCSVSQAAGPAHTTNSNTNTPHTPQILRKRASNKENENNTRELKRPKLPSRRVSFAPDEELSTMHLYQKVRMCSFLRATTHTSAS